MAVRDFTEAKDKQSYFVNGINYDIVVTNTHTACEDMTNILVAFGTEKRQDNNYANGYESLSGALNLTPTYESLQDALNDIGNRVKIAGDVLAVLESSYTLYKSKYDTCVNESKWYSCQKCKNLGFERSKLEKAKTTAKDLMGVYTVTLASLKDRLVEVKDEAEYTVELSENVAEANVTIAEANSKIAEAEGVVGSVKALEFQQTFYTYIVPIVLGLLAVWFVYRAVLKRK